MKQVFSILTLLVFMGLNAQIIGPSGNFTRQDSLRGSNNEFRNWWNVLKYNIEVEPDFESKFLKGSNTLEFEITKRNHGGVMQIDLQEPMKLTAVELNGTPFTDFQREGNVYFLNVGSLDAEKPQTLKLGFEGHPRIAKNPPWDGGWIFTTDGKGNPWMTVACEGLGASVWFPNKDYLADEPDRGAEIAIKVPVDLVGVSNGRLADIFLDGDKATYVWEVVNPINNYNIIPYIGNYSEIKDSYLGEKGELTLDYWVLDYNVNKAKKQFEQAKTMIKAFEKWFGPYPFYEDGYKLVEAPHLGMEHQSGLAYGNGFEDGYLGTDLSESGWGLKWDFIIIHESGHEWFGNSITNKDVADMWIHEGFTAYSEALYTEELFGKEAGQDYVIGTRRRIQNDRPIIGTYGVNRGGSGDMYNKAANMIHTWRQWLNDDELFMNILRGMNQKFYHKTVTTKEIEDYMSRESKINLTAFFNQYLRTTQIPTLEYQINGNRIKYRWTNVVKKFKMPVKLANSEEWLYPTDYWKSQKLPEGLAENFAVDRNFLVETKRLN